MAMTVFEGERERSERPCWGLGDPKVMEIPADAHTYEGFLDWVLSDALPEKLRVTFLAGTVILDMSEEDIQAHVAVKGGVYGTLISLVGDEDIGEFYMDGVLIGNKAAGVSNNPDGVAVLWESIEAGRVRYLTRKGDERVIEGSPDWVMEIIDDSSVIRDTKRLCAAYHRAKIPEYWLIDAREMEIVFQILSWRKSGYAAVPSKDDWTFSKVFGRSFRLTRKKDRLGGWKYTLEARTETK